MDHASMQKPRNEEWDEDDGYLQCMTTNRRETTRDQANNEIVSRDSPQGSTKSQGHDGPSMPCSFDESWSSLENGNSSQAKGISLLGRILDKLHLHRYYQDDVDQIIHSLDEYPSGYGKVAAIENTDPEFLIYRKFGWLRNYDLLHLQDELATLEDDLVSFDKWNLRAGDRTLLVSRRKDYAVHSRREKIMASVHSKLKEYDEALLRTQKVDAIKRPSKRSQQNVHNCISNTQSLVSEESDWIREGTDLAALGHAAERGWLNTFLADTFNFISTNATSVSAEHSLPVVSSMQLSQYGAILFPLSMIIITLVASLLYTSVGVFWGAFSNILEQKLFRTHEQAIKTGDEELTLVSLERLENVVRAIVTISAAVLLLLPVSVLLKLQVNDRSQVERNSHYQILTIFVSTVLFSTFCSIFTQATKQDVFTATAAYSAVLVVFLGSISSALVDATNTRACAV